VRIELNGKPHELEAPVSVSDFLRLIGAKPQVAVAINGEVVRRADWESVEVAEGDVVEVVRAVGGGS
jgi:sulfur carrier protein